MLRGLAGGLFNTGLFTLLLLVPASLVTGGTWYWPRALVLLAVYGGLVAASVVVLALRAPASLEARFRMRLSRRQPPADRVITACIVLYFFAWVAFIPLDVFSLTLLPSPHVAVSAGGGILAVLGFAIMLAAIAENPFAAPVVEDQTDRGQVVVDTGLYAHVRHPMYLGALPFLAGIALWLGSYAAAAATVVFLGILIARIAVEEGTLRRTLPGYGEYMQRVRYRLVPLLW